MKAVHARRVALVITLGMGIGTAGQRGAGGVAASPRDVAEQLYDNGRTLLAFNSALPSARISADTTPIRFRPADTAIKLDVGTFGPCERDFDRQTRVASIYCPKMGSPEEREFIFINVYFARIWADSADALTVARMIRDSGSPGLITESAFSAPDGPASTALTYFLVQTRVQPDNAHGNVFLVSVSQESQAVVALLYGQRFDTPGADLRERERRWLAQNLATHMNQLGRISLDPSWFGALRALAR